jgi:hypothetical protein
MLPFIRDVRRLASRRETAGRIGFTSRRKATVVLLLIAAGIGAGAGGLTCPSPAAEPGPGKPGNGDNKAPADTETRLAKVLQEWEQATRSAREFHYTYTVTNPPDVVLNKPPDILHGEVFISRPHRLRLEVRDAAGKPLWIVLAKDGQVSVYNFESKRLISAPWENPAAVPGLNFRGDNWIADNWLGRLLVEVWWTYVGFPVPDLKERFVVRLAKEDKHWTYLRLDAKERGWFGHSDLQVVLAKEGRWVRRIWTKGGTGGVTVDCTEPQQGPIPPQAWEPPFQELPKGWEADPIGTPDPPAPKGSPKGREGPR